MPSRGLYEVVGLSPLNKSKFHEGKEFCLFFFFF